MSRTVQSLRAGRRIRARYSHYAWVTVGGLLIAAGVISIWVTYGFRAVQVLMSPFDVIYVVVALVTLAPGLAALAYANKLKQR
jgi:hypothetical protein